MYLSQNTFQNVVSASPLISIDLIIDDGNGCFLLGKRNNKPAKGTWFVPGGRVTKNETLDDAFIRLCNDELNIQMQRSNAEFLGVYEHFYSDSVFSDEISTHYIVLAYKIQLQLSEINLPKEQHNAYSWMKPCDILEDSNVHLHTKWYFE